MKYTVPADCCAVAHDGRQVAPDADGTLDLDEADAAALAPHGLTPAKDEPPHDSDDGRPSRRGRA